jgi:hypothetical protein
MFHFLHRSATRYPSIREALVAAGVPSAADPAVLSVLKHQGSYVGRHVSYFRAFDPTSPTARAKHIQSYADLDAHAELVLGSGHVEREGLVVVNGRRTAEGQTPSRWKADRAVHADDERFVNRNAELARLAASEVPSAIA